MTAAQDLTAIISDAVTQVQKGSFDLKEIYTNQEAPVGKNEFLFFIKPEITIPSDKIRLNKILELIRNKIQDFGFTIHNIKVLSAAYLNRHDIIAQHYGVINKIASNAVGNMSEGAKDKFKEFFGKDVQNAKVLGGIEFLAHYPDFNPNSIDFLLQNIEAKKLAGGTYCAKIKMDNEIVYLVNGFHPRQLKQFTEKGRSIIVMTLSSDLNWKEARTNFIGATNPEAAMEGSIRRTLLEQKDALGLDEISQGVNGVHLSAGPVEGLVELRRYNTDFSKNEDKAFTDFSFGRKLQEQFTDEQLEKIISNENVVVDGKVTSIFDITEEMNADEAIATLKSVLQ